MNANIPPLLSFMLPSLSLAAAIDYPETRKMDLVDQLHGTTVADPYRWLEDDNSEETKAWVIAQNRVTEDFLSAIPQRGEIRKRLADLWNFERTGAPKEFGGRWFFTHNTGLQNQSVLKVSETLDGEARVLLDPNQLSEDGTVALAGFEPSEDGLLDLPRRQRLD
jgi:prolyl oligopeptidase